MSTPLWRPRQWDAHVPPRLKEPYPWAHPNYRGSLHPFSNPRNALLFGAALVAAGLLLAGTSLGAHRDSGDPAALWTGAFLLVMFAGVGAWGIHLGSTRLRWIRRFRAEYGFSPFDRQPDDAAPLRSREHG